MKYLIYLLLTLSLITKAQRLDTLKSSWYGRVMPYGIYTGYGKMIDRQFYNVEFGRTIGIMDFGIAVGKISQRPDSTTFVEGKITMDACQIGLFSNEFTIGVGHVFKSETPIMLEASSTIFAQLGKYWGVGIVTGYNDYSGETYSVGKSYFGLYLRFGLLRNEGGFLMNRRIKLKHHIR